MAISMLSSNRTFAKSSYLYSFLVMDFNLALKFSCFSTFLFQSYKTILLWANLRFKTKLPQSGLCTSMTPIRIVKLSTSVIVWCLNPFHHCIKFILCPPLEQPHNFATTKNKQVLSFRTMTISTAQNNHSQIDILFLSQKFLWHFVRLHLPDTPKSTYIFAVNQSTS